MTRRLSTNVVNQRLASQGIQLVGEWKGNKKQHRFQCQSCNHEWEAQGGGPSNAKSGCPKCNGFPYSPLLTTQEVNQRLVPLGIQLVGDWRGAWKDNHFRCTLGHEWQVEGRGVLTEGNGCPECYRLRFKNLRTYRV